MVEELRHRVVRYKYIDAPVPVIIGKSYAQTLARFSQANPFRNLSKVTVAFVVIHQRGNGLENIRMAIFSITLLVLTAPDVVEVPLQVSKNDQIQPAVIVQVHPGCAGGPAVSSDPGVLRHVRECAITIVVVELVASVGGHI